MADSTPPLDLQRVSEMFHRFIAAAESALTAENVDPATIRRVMNRFLVGHPDGIDAFARMDPPAGDLVHAEGEL